MSRKMKDAPASAEVSDLVEEALASPAADDSPAPPANGPAADETQEAPAAAAPAIVVTVGFDGVPDGAIYGRRFEPGDVVEGDLAALALREGWAELRA